MVFQIKEAGRVGSGRYNARKKILIKRTRRNLTKLYKEIQKKMEGGVVPTKREINFMMSYWSEIGILEGLERNNTN